MRNKPAFSRKTVGDGGAPGKEARTPARRPPASPDEGTRPKTIIPGLRTLGSDNGSAKLSEAAVAAILDDLDRGVRQVDIAKKHGVCQAAISHIATGRRRREFVTTTRKVAEVARFVQSKARALGASEDPRDVAQEAALAALETRDRYWRKMKGDPFNYLAGAAFIATNLAAQRQRRPVSISEGAATGRVKCEVPACGYESLYRHSEGEDTAEERFGGPFEVVAPLRGEGARRMRVVAILRGLSRSEQSMAAKALEGGDLRDLARHGKVTRARAVLILRRLRRAVGPDPVAAKLARVISGS